MEENEKVVAEQAQAVQETEAPKVEAPVAEEAPKAEAEKVEEAPKAEEAAPAKEETKKATLNASIDPDKFDWDSFENSTDYEGQDRKKVEELYDQTLSKIVKNEVVEGTVTAISKREVLVNIGYKSEGVIPASEFHYNPNLKEGDKVDVYVDSEEDKKGQLVLSHKKARALKSWDRVNAAYEKGEIVNGYIKTRTKGGMIVDVFGIEAFLPGSQI
ncbi:MAG: S1 RNA-binding domain-containing protein, partial [Bacteroidales bacterium]